MSAGGRRERPVPPLPAGLHLELSRLKPVALRVPRRQLVLVTLASLAWAGGILGVASFRDDLAGLPFIWLALYLAAWLLSFVLLLYAALVPGPGSLMPRPRLGGPLAAISVVGFVIAGFVFSRPGPEAGLGGADHCLTLGVLTAIVPVVIGTLMLRGIAITGSRVVAAALGAAGGCLGGLLLHLHCHISDGTHLGVIHGGVVAVAAALAAAIAAPIMRA
jgi:hypothetical protein